MKLRTGIATALAAVGGFAVFRMVTSKDLRVGDIVTLSRLDCLPDGDAAFQASMSRAPTDASLGGPPSGIINRLGPNTSPSLPPMQVRITGIPKEGQSGTGFFEPILKGVCLGNDVLNVPVTFHITRILVRPR